MFVLATIAEHSRWRETLDLHLGCSYTLCVADILVIIAIAVSNLHSYMDGYMVYGHDGHGRPIGMDLNGWICVES